MGRRSRRRGEGRASEPSAPTSEYVDAEGNALVLRGVLSPATRREYAATLRGERTGSAGGEAAREDAHQRATELLFERLAVRWTIAELPIEGQRALLGRYRMASAAERATVRDALRRHAAEHFPELEVP